QFQGAAAWQGIQEQLEVFSPRELIFPNSLAPLLNHARSQGKLADKADRTNGTDGTDGTEVPLEVTLSDSGSKSEPLSDSEFSLLIDKVLPPSEDWIFGFDHADSLLRSQLSVTSWTGSDLLVASMRYARQAGRSITSTRLRRSTLCTSAK